jgi:hypothetical protein
MAVILSIMGLVITLFIAVLASTVIGGVVGWIVEAVFPFVAVTLNGLAGTELTGFELGAVLGFFGSFFRSSCSSK